VICLVKPNSHFFLYSKIPTTIHTTNTISHAYVPVWTRHEIYVLVLHSTHHSARMMHYPLYATAAADNAWTCSKLLSMLVVVTHSRRAQQQARMDSKAAMVICMYARVLFKGGFRFPDNDCTAAALLYRT
jgi:predicted nucleic acid-binding protein